MVRRESRSLPGVGRVTDGNPGRDHPRLPHPAARPSPRHPPSASLKNRRRTTSGKSWPPTACSVTPPAAPTTTAQPPTPPHHRPPAHTGRHLLTVPLSAASTSPSPTEPPTPLQPMSHRHHCGPARCAGTDSCAIRAEQLAHNPNHYSTPPRTLMGTDTSSAVDQPVTAANPKPPRDKVMRIATMTKTRRSPYPTAGYRRP